MKEIINGVSGKITALVSDNMLAVSVGSGEVSVYATPMMVALIEKAASSVLSQFLDEGETSVGTNISVNHIAATPIGMSVYAIAEIKAADGRKVTFDVKAYDECGLIGKGTHERFIVIKDKFNAKAKAKLNEK